MIYTYLVCSLTALIIWTIFFYLRKDLRKSMIYMGVIIAVLGFLGGLFMFTQDWWRPETLTNTSVGIEDLLLGFGLGGIAFAYPVIWKKKTVLKEKVAQKRKLLIVLLGFGSHIILFFIAGLHSFYSSAVGMLLPALAIYYFRKDLIKPSIIMASLSVFWAFFAFNILNIIDQGFVYRWYILSKLSGIIFLNTVPEDLIWFFAGGMLFTVLYPFWTGKKFADLDKPKK